MEKIFDWIGDLFTKIWRLFKKILPYIMIALAVFFTFGGSLVLLGMTLTGYAAAVAAMGISFIVAPDETVDVVTDVAEDVGTAAGAIVSTGIGGLASGLFGGENGWLWALLIAGGVYLLIRGNNDDSRSSGKEDGDAVNGEADGVSIGTLQTAGGRSLGGSTV